MSASGRAFTTSLNLPAPPSLQLQVVTQRLHGGKATVISQEPRLALGVEKVNHGSHKFRVVSPHVVEMDLLVQVKSFLVLMTLELFLHRRAKRLYTYIYGCTAI